MIEFGGQSDNSELEALVRKAAGYVRASDDLRPRVLETARSHRTERRAQGWIRKAAMVVVLLTGLSAAIGQAVDHAVAGHELAITAIDSGRMHSRAAKYAAPSGDVAWGMVEAFSELRRRQTAAFRL